MGFSIRLSLNPAASSAFPTAGCVLEGQQVTRALLKEQEITELPLGTLRGKPSRPSGTAWIPGGCHSAGRGISSFCLEETCSGHYELFGRESSDISALGSSRKGRGHGEGPMAEPQQLRDGNEASHQLWGRTFAGG